MKIGFNYTSTIGTGGNATYARELIKGLSEIDKNNQYYLYYYVHDFLRRKIPRYVNKNFKSKPVYFSRLKFPIPRSFINFINKISLRIWTKFDGIDVFHFTNPLDFIRGHYKSIVTIHDLAVLHNENWAKKISLNFYKKNIKKVLNQSDKIITDSNFTKKDIVRFFNIREDKIRVVPLCANSRFRPDLNKDYLKEKFNLENYILYVGELQPRKNIIRLLEAYSKLDIDLRQNYNLVLVGRARDNDFKNKVNEAIKEFKIGEQVKQFGYVVDDDLPKLYSGARFLIYPSLLEGFGLPVLESLSCGTPVIASNTSSLPEVVGQAGILVDPENIEQIGSSMKKLLLDNELYKKLKINCLNQASRFGCQKTAKETLAVYEKVYKE